MASPTTSFGLIERARTGDQEAFARLFARHERRVAALIRYRAGGALAGEIDDLLQETFMRAFASLDRFEYGSAGAFYRWLASIACCVVIDAARYKGRERRAGRHVPFRSESNPAGPEPADTKTPSRIMGHKEAIDTVLAKIEALPPDYREVVALAKLECLTTAEIAERLGKSREAVALLLHRALKRLREA